MMKGLKKRERFLGHGLVAIEVRAFFCRLLFGGADRVIHGPAFIFAWVTGGRVNKRGCAVSR